MGDAMEIKRDIFKTVYGYDISLNIIRVYTEHLKDTFIISEASRYDVKESKRCCDNQYGRIEEIEV
jgi:hypothetical protein